jgi:hypothetical protein
LVLLYFSRFVISYLGNCPNNPNNPLRQQPL